MAPPNIFDIIKEYLQQMLPIDDTMKVLLVDDSTLEIISVAFTQSQLLERSVFLVDNIKNYAQRRALPTMRAICFVRPTSIKYLCEELQDSKYPSYTINFSNAVSVETLDQLARADAKDAIVRVQEYFADCIAVNRDSFVIPFRKNAITSHILDENEYQRVASGLAATFVAMRRKPLIRFTSKSALCRSVATELASVFRSDLELYDYRSRDTLVLLVDRSEDPATPLLTPWTYQAMIHDLVGIDHNRVTLPDATGDDAEGYVFSQKDDDFFAKNMYHNWGDLCQNVKAYVDHCKTVLQMDRSTATIDEVKQFMQKLPQTRSLAGSVTKHVNVVSHISHEITRRHLLEVSQLEQDMTVRFAQADHWNRLVELIHTSKLAKDEEAARLCFLYNLRYERGAAGSRAESLLASSEARNSLAKLRAYFGLSSAAAPLFSDGSEAGGMFSTVVGLVKGFKDVKNIYTQHEPWIKTVLTAAGQGRLESEAYPYLGAAAPAGWRPKDIIVFFCGGYTFEEAALVNSINNGWRSMDHNAPTDNSASRDGQLPNIQVLIGGTGVHNFKSFMEALNFLP